jgi:hypothetical protein
MGSGRLGVLNLSGSAVQGDKRFMQEANHFVSPLKGFWHGRLGFEGRLA